MIIVNEKIRTERVGQANGLRHDASLFALILVATAALTAGCSSSRTPTSPTTSPTVSGVALNVSTVSAGTTVQGTVSLSGSVDTAGASLSLSSSNTAVAAVVTPLLISAGKSSATFFITTAAAGSTTITASMGSSSASSLLTVTGAPALSSISLSAPTVVGTNPVLGTVTLSGAAGVGGASIALSGSGPVDVPATVFVSPGLVSATFDVATRLVGGSIVATVSATYAGVSKSATLTVVPVPPPTVATASFGVSGAQTDTCTLTNGGNTLDCTFDGSTSTAPGTIVEWNWTYSAVTTFTQTTTGPLLSMPVANCAFIPAPPLGQGMTSFPLTVRLTVRDSLGNVSAEAVNTSQRVLPQGSCGF